MVTTLFIILLMVASFFIGSRIGIRLTIERHYEDPSTVVEDYLNLNN
jgi:hypothetical protein